VRQKRFLWECDAGGIARPLNYLPASRPRRQDFDGFLVENGAFYVTGRELLRSSGCRLSGRIVCHEMDEETYVELDEPADWEAVGAMLLHRAPAVGGFADRIKLVLTDVDGVLTDGGMYYGNEGDLLKRFNTRDGMGMELLRHRGILTGIITGEQTEMVSQRARKLQVDILVQGCRDKLPALRQILADRNLKASEVAYIGDDLNDLEVLANVGYSGAPADATVAVRKMVDYVCATKGGAGCFREFAEQILARHQPDAIPS
jgi:N-acylneuraminate cytidylyltransferase